MEIKSFEFGKNWWQFTRKFLSQESIEEAKKSILEFCHEYSLKGKSFVDVGCGSGLFSLAAYQLGASKILSFDIDPFSVNCCQYLREEAGNPSFWEVVTGSILDESFVIKLGKYDFVYSWGVLHHTGKMWTAIANTSKLVGPDGLLYLAIYNKADGFAIYPDGRLGSSWLWSKIKKNYLALPSLLQNSIDYGLMSLLIIIYLVTLNNPIRKIRSHKELRGMSWRIDIKDWLGGYPYEYASVSEVFSFVKKLGFTLENLKNNNGLRNNEYLFKKI